MKAYVDEVFASYSCKAILVIGNTSIQSEAFGEFGFQKYNRDCFA